MSGPGGDWRNGPAYDFVDELAPEQVPVEFLRRNPDYLADYHQLAAEPAEQGPPQALAHWGCDFAVNPELPAAATHPIWLPRVNPRLSILTALPRTLFGSPALDAADPRLRLSAPEGAYIDLAALPPARQALLLAHEAGAAIGFVVPFDALFEDRLDAARRLHRLLTRGEVKPADISAYRRGRLKLALRALDGKLAGAGYREIARGLFPRLLGEDREPSEMVVGRAIRLVRYGVRLMKGGYLDLLRPERRAPRSRRK